MIWERKHIHLRNFDYAAEGWYFVTICSKNRNCIPGNIENGEMVHSSIGLQAKSLWEEIPKHFPQVELGEFVIMSNHVHGMIAIYNDVVRRAVACYGLTTIC